jgi:hypothetical protein
MIKKEFVFIIFGVLLIGALIGFVSAETTITQDLSSFIDGARDVLTMFFSKILGQAAADSNLFFERVLILLVVFGIIYSVLNNIDLFSNSPFLLFFTSAAVAILGIRLLNDSLINTILIPYGALGASIGIFLPFLIWFFFVHTSVKGTFARRAAWFIFGLVFIGFWIARYTLSSGTNWIYFFGFIFVAFSMLFDSQIHKYFGYVKASKGVALYNIERVAILQRDIQRINELEAKGAISSADANAIIKQKQKLIKKRLGQT